MCDALSAKILLSPSKKLLMSTDSFLCRLFDFIYFFTKMKTTLSSIVRFWVNKHSSVGEFNKVSNFGRMHEAVFSFCRNIKFVRYIRFGCWNIIFSLLWNFEITKSTFYFRTLPTRLFTYCFYFFILLFIFCVAPRKQVTAKRTPPGLSNRWSMFSFFFD